MDRQLVTYSCVLIHQLFSGETNFLIFVKEKNTHEGLRTNIYIRYTALAV